jgi:protein-tyrosine phosphatase
VGREGTEKVIDIHCHPLAAVDDGAEEFATSVAMCRLAAADGITHIVATPHCNYEFPFDFALNQSKITELQAAIGDVPRLMLGCDFHVSYDNLTRLAENSSQFTINQKQYLLVELDDHFVPQQYDRVLYNLQLANVVPVLTHPERNTVFRRKSDLVSKWVERGWLIQATAQSYCGGFGEAAKRLTELWLKHNLIHFFASDAHDEEYRPPLLSPCYEKLSRKHGKDVAERLLVKNPEAVINGEQLPSAPDPVRWSEPKRRRWFSFLHS